jgi:hypothetical protein
MSIQCKGFVNFPIAIQVFPHQPAHGTLRTLRTTSGMGVTTQKTSRSLLYFPKFKKKRNFLDPTQEKSKKKEKTSENITFIFSPQTFFVKKKIKNSCPLYFGIPPRSCSIGFQSQRFHALI